MRSRPADRLGSGMDDPMGSVRPVAPSDDTAGVGYYDYCPNCSHRLQNQRCKYRCPRCHYFMSCSDFDQ